VPIITVTRNANTCRSAHLYRGVYPCLYPRAKPADPSHWQEDVDARLKWGMRQAIDLGLISIGDAVIAVQGWTGGLGHSNTLRVRDPEATIADLRSSKQACRQRKHEFGLMGIRLIVEMSDMVLLVAISLFHSELRLLKSFRYAH
jgi:hypothetical protein